MLPLPCAGQRGLPGRCASVLKTKGRAASTGAEPDSAATFENWGGREEAAAAEMERPGGTAASRVGRQPGRTDKGGGAGSGGPRRGPGRARPGRGAPHLLRGRGRGGSDERREGKGREGERRRRGRRGRGRGSVRGGGRCSRGPGAGRGGARPASQSARYTSAGRGRPPRPSAPPPAGPGRQPGPGSPLVRARPRLCGGADAAGPRAGGLRGSGGRRKWRGRSAPGGKGLPCGRGGAVASAGAVLPHASEQSPALPSNPRGKLGTRISFVRRTQGQMSSVLPWLGSNLRVPEGLDPSAQIPRGT